MKYTVDEIDFKSITPKEFENLCYDLLIKYNFRNLIWKQWGADNGRDIEARYVFTSMIQDKKLKYFIECKHYSSWGVPVGELQTKIAWADAENPNSLIFFITSYLTTSAREWIRKIESQKQYDIIIIEGEELKNRLVQFPELVERYFSRNKYDKLLKDLKDYHVKFNILPSYEFLCELIDNVEIERLNDEDIVFILISFYRQYDFFEQRDDYYGDFDWNKADKILDYLKTTVKNKELLSITNQKEDYTILWDYGFINELDWRICELSEDVKQYSFMGYEIHLNYKQEKINWKIGHYLFIKYKDVAFEIYKTETIEMRIIENVSYTVISLLSIDIPDVQVANYMLYLDHFSDNTNN